MSEDWLLRRALVAVLIYVSAISFVEAIIMSLHKCLIDSNKNSKETEFFAFIFTPSAESPHRPHSTISIRFHF